METIYYRHKSKSYRYTHDVQAITKNDKNFGGAAGRLLQLYTVIKRLGVIPSLAGISLTSDVPDEDGKTANLFLQCNI